MYSHAFYVILPVIYTSLGLTPLAAGLMGTVRSLGSGASSTVGGFLIDRLQHRRLMILYLTLITMGLGYVAVGLAPNYVLIVAALAFAAMAGSIWHPAARSLLSQIYPRRRGMMISLDRSAGSVGDTVGPVAAGALLVVMAWQQIFLLALPISLLMMLFLWSFLRRAETFQELGARSRGESRPLSGQFREIRELLASNGRVLTILLLVKGIIGLGMGGLVLWIPLYLQETVGMGSVGIGFHVALLTGVGVVTSPAFGYLSDRMGRLPVVLLALGGKAAVAALMAAFGSGVMLTILIGAMGVFMTGIQPIVQAWALDIAHGRKLEGTMMGALYGSNLAFHAAGPLVVGAVVTFIGFNNLFWYVAAMQTAAFLFVTASLLLLGRKPQPVAGHGD
jgi:MFS family permease